MFYTVYENIGECCMCDKKAEVIYTRYRIFGLKTRVFCKNHAREHHIIKRTH